MCCIPMPIPCFKIDETTYWTFFSWFFCRDTYWILLDFLGSWPIPAYNSRPMSRWHWSAWGKAWPSWVCKKSGHFPSACFTRNSEDPVANSNFWTPDPEKTLPAHTTQRFWMAGWMKWIVLSMQRPSTCSKRIWRNLAFHMKAVRLVMRKLAWIWHLRCIYGQLPMLVFWGQVWAMPMAWQKHGIDIAAKVWNAWPHGGSDWML